MRILGAALALLLVLAGSASAQTIDLGQLTQGADGQTVGTIIQVFGLLTVLSIAPNS